MGLATLPLQTCGARPANFWHLNCTRSDVRAHKTLNTQGQRKHASRILIVRAAGPGGGVAEPPVIRLPGFDVGKTTRKQNPRDYRVMLHNDNFNRREYVVQVLLKIINGLTVDDAVNVMNEAHLNGLACAVISNQEEAERYCEGLRSNGLISSIEPCGGGGGSDDGPVA